MNKKIYIPLLIVSALIVFSVGFYFLRPKTPGFGSTSTFRGVIKTGAQLGELKNYCAEGLYLVSQDDSFLANEQKILQLRLPDAESNTRMYTDNSFIDSQVEVVGKYPAQEIFCEALMCDCEDYILLENEESITPLSSS